MKGWECRRQREEKRRLEAGASGRRKSGPANVQGVEADAVTVRRPHGGVELKYSNLSGDNQAKKANYTIQRTREQQVGYH